ncbi:MAG: hypothetical protein ACRDV0_05990 [Acidimicrobiales bacterium]
MTPALRRDAVLTAFSLGAILEIAWTVYLGWRLPRHYVADHWDVAWVGLDSAQVALLVLAAWSAWRRRAELMLIACVSGSLLLVDAWFDVTTARYRDVDKSLWFLVIEVPLAVVMFWIAWRIYRHLTAPDAHGRSRANLDEDWRGSEPSD